MKIASDNTLGVRRSTRNKLSVVEGVIRRWSMRNAPALTISTKNSREFYECTHENHHNVRIGFAMRDRIKVKKYEPATGGTIATVGDGIAWTSGLRQCCLGEVVRIYYDKAPKQQKDAEARPPRYVQGMIMVLEEDKTGISLLCPPEDPALRRVTPGTRVSGTRCQIQTSVPSNSKYMFGRVLGWVGDPIDGKPIYESPTAVPINVDALSIFERRPVNEPLFTGLTTVDTTIPIGLGQRAAVIGDRRCGKSELALTAITTQQNSGLAELGFDKDVCAVYAVIGQRTSVIVSLLNSLRERDVLSRTALVTCPVSDAASQRSLVPYSAVASAEHAARAGRNVLVVYDDLTRHAEACQELCLLLRQPPGIDSWPVNSFTQHAQLLERAGAFSTIPGSITALPIIETEEGDITAYIPTNVISITDGQAILDRELFLEGQRPAIDTSVSVSRLGGAVQPKMLKPVSSDLKVALVLVKRARALVQVSSEADLPDDKKQDLRVGRALDAVLKQGPGESRTPAEHVTLLQAALFRGGASFAGLSEEELGLAIKILSETLAKANPNVEDQSAGSLYPIKRIIASAIREERNLTQSEQIVVASAPIISGATTYRLRQESCSAV